MYARVQEGKWGIDEGVDGDGDTGAGAAEDEDGFEASGPHLPLGRLKKYFPTLSHLHLPSTPALTHT